MPGRFLLLSSMLLSVRSVLADGSSFDQNAGAAANRLVSGDYYSSDQGLWTVGGNVVWWNSANVLTALVGTMALDSSQRDQHQSIIANTYANAPAANPHSTRKRDLSGNWVKHYQRRSPAEIRQRLRKRESADFTNGFYDDEGWWALAWLDAHDLTGDIHYLNTAIDIWNDMKGGDSSACPGGIWWDKKHSSVNAIANALYISVSAHIANRVGDNVRQTYIDAAQNSWNWFQGTGMINSQNLINDGVDLSTCKNNNGAIFTYNQGVILGGLVELSKATGDTSLLDRAADIANAATATGGQLTDSNGILHDGCDKNSPPSCGNDGDQFKGIFVRNLRRLNDARPSDNWKTFLQNNARSIWDNNSANDNGQITLGTTWSGPYYQGDAITQSSALDALNGALAASQ